MKKLKVAILWHQHQPYYKYEDEFLLPWVRLHGVKDYYDLPALLHDYPTVKQTFNLAPSLMLQINDYIKNNTCDKIQRLTKLDAKLLNDNEKREILDCFFTLNYENMVRPYSRFKELCDKCQNKENALKSLTTQEWLDIQVWYNLTWLGQISRKFPIGQRLFKKGCNFTENEKLLLLEFHNEILEKITSEMSKLQKLGQIEISCSPMYHPILPLLCDSNSAHEAMPKIELPNPIYRYSEDAKSQIEDGIDYYSKLFQNKPQGMWPSEGSISNETLELIAGAGIKWIASDEGILAASLKEEYKSTYKYFPYEVNTKNGNITLFFRDHNLSDKIGFVYSNWNGFDAANDFRETLIAIRNEIIQNHGDNALDSAVVPIILDGENCWEFYYENGIYFLKDFFKMLENTDVIETVLFSECLNTPTPNFLPKLSNIRAGSWINSNFSIWIGHSDDIKAWNMLSKVRKLVDDNKSKLSNDQYEKIMDDIYIAEGSDWFWWYGPEHNAPNKRDFDILFRWRIQKIYEQLGIDAPDDLKVEITEANTMNLLEPPKNRNITPIIDGNLESDNYWNDAGKVNLNAGMSTMHKIGEIISRVLFCYDSNFVYFRITLMENIGKNDKLEFIAENDTNNTLVNVIYMNGSFDINSQNVAKIKFAANEVVDIAIDRAFFNRKLKFKINTLSNSNSSNININTSISIVYPHNNFYIYELE